MPASPTELSPKPQPPEGYDCCGGGCADCELRLYLKRLKAWQKLAEAQAGLLRPSDENRPQGGS